MTQKDIISNIKNIDIIKKHNVNYYTYDKPEITIQSLIKLK